MNRRLTASAVALACVLAAAPGFAQHKVLNLYSSRHYQTDEALYANFTKLTGIKINRIEAGEDALIERIRNEGARSPADVLITVDAGRLWRADQLGLFQPVKSAVLDSRIPASFRDPSGDWFGFSMRARVIAYDRTKVKAGEITTYEQLADPRWKGKICSRSGSHIYNLSLMGAMIDHLGEAKAEDWARAVKSNLARDPKGGDTDQIKGVAAGECELAITNTYYWARLARSDKAEEKAIADRVGIIMPNQSTWGTHVNISGAGVLKNAPNRDAAIRFLEYLASDEAQSHFADGNNEWPVVKTAAVRNPALEALGRFEADALDVGTLSKNTAIAQKIFDRAGWR